MISIDEQKSPDSIKEAQGFESKPEVLKGVFSPKELKKLNEIKTKAYQDQERCAEKLLSKDKEALGKMAHPNASLKEQIENIVRPKLKSILTEDYKMEFSFHRNFFPYGIHTDSGYDQNEKIYKQGIIPLEILPQGGEVYTVIFDQKAYHSISYPKDIETIKALKPNELNQIKSWSKEPIDKEELSKYWNDPTNTFSKFKGLSVALPFKWQMGSMAIWDRAHLHCSSDFSVHGIEGKWGLMWISRRV